MGKTILVPRQPGCHQARMEEASVVPTRRYIEARARTGTTRGRNRYGSDSGLFSVAGGLTSPDSLTRNKHSIAPKRYILHRLHYRVYGPPAQGALMTISRALACGSGPLLLQPSTVLSFGRSPRCCRCAFQVAQLLLHTLGMCCLNDLSSLSNVGFLRSIGLLSSIGLPNNKRSTSNGNFCARANVWGNHRPQRCRKVAVLPSFQPFRWFPRAMNAAPTHRAR